MERLQRLGQKGYVSKVVFEISPPPLLILFLSGGISAKGGHRRHHPYTARV